jgi:cytochrome c peroxidase
LTDEEFHNTGVSFGTANRDVGRYEFTKDPADRFRFKTPSLVGVALTAPYFHDGSAATLEDVVRFYNRGGAADDPQLDPRIRPLELDGPDVTALADFLRALSPEPPTAR